MSFERVQGKKVEERVPKAKSTNYIPARTSRKVEILEQGKNFSGQCYVKLNRAVREVKYKIILLEAAKNLGGNNLNTSKLVL